MAKNEVVEYDKTVIVSIIKVGDYKEFVKKDESKGSIQSLEVKFESGNKTILKIWDREHYAFKSGHDIKVTHVNDVKESYGQFAYINIHTTSKSEIVYPFTRQTTLKEHAESKEPLDKTYIIAQLDTIRESLVKYIDKVDELEKAFTEFVNLPKVKKLLPVKKEDSKEENKEENKK